MSCDKLSNKDDTSRGVHALYYPAIQLMKGFSPTLNCFGKTQGV